VLSEPQGYRATAGRALPRTLRTDGIEEREEFWKWSLLALCALSLFTTLAVAADEFGLGGKPWFGWWDSNVAIAQPYTVAIARPRPDGAAARGGLRDGDRIDLRRQNLEARIAILYQPMATGPTTLTIDRRTSPRVVRLSGSTVWEHATLWKLQPMVSRLGVNVWLTLCALLIALLQWRKPAARVISLILVCTVGKMLDPSFVVVPSAPVAVLLLIVSRACATLALLLLVRFSSHFGARSEWRAVLEYVAYAIIPFGFLADAVVVVGLVTVRLDPLPYVQSLGAWRGYFDIVACLLILLTAGAAVSVTRNGRQLQSACLLLPLPLAFLTSAVLFTIPVFANSWFETVAVIAVANAALLLGTLIVTYTLLSQRRLAP
jgi:hypothetical protein